MHTDWLYLAASWTLSLLWANVRGLLCFKNSVWKIFQNTWRVSKLGFCMFGANLLWLASIRQCVCPCKIISFNLHGRTTSVAFKVDCWTNVKGLLGHWLQILPYVRNGSPTKDFLQKAWTLIANKKFVRKITSKLLESKPKYIRWNGHWTGPALPHPGHCNRHAEWLNA